MRNIFADIFKGKVIIVGIGNILRGDDGFGPALIKEIEGMKKIACFDAGSAPENYAGKIIKEKPDTILIIDAVHMGRRAGEYDILESSEILKSGFTTHDISPRMFLDYLEKETRANIYLLGIQPQNISLGEKMSAPVKKTLQDLTNLIKEAKICMNHI